MNLRRHQRFPVHMQSVVTGPTSSDSAGLTVNLSKQGCLIETASQVDPGTAVTLRINVPNDAAPIHIARAVIQWNLVGNVGLSFITVAPSEQARLDQLLERMSQDRQT